MGCCFHGRFFEVDLDVHANINYVPQLVLTREEYIVLLEP
jgi:hypothetical protein